MGFMVKQYSIAIVDEVVFRTGGVQGADVGSGTTVVVFTEVREGDFATGYPFDRGGRAR